MAVSTKGRIADIKRRLAARTNVPGYEENVVFLEKQLKSLEDNGSSF